MTALINLKRKGLAIPALTTTIRYDADGIVRRIDFHSESTGHAWSGEGGAWKSINLSLPISIVKRHYGWGVASESIPHVQAALTTALTKSS